MRRYFEFFAVTIDNKNTRVDSIDVSTLIGLRDRALIAVMTFAFARICGIISSPARS